MGRVGLGGLLLAGVIGCGEAGLGVRARRSSPDRACESVRSAGDAGEALDAALGAFASVTELRVGGVCVLGRLAGRFSHCRQRGCESVGGMRVASRSRLNTRCACASAVG
jgi:hypothetical protein